MLDKLFRGFLFAAGLALLLVSIHGAFLINLSLETIYPWRWDMTLDDRPLYFAYSLPIFALWVVVLLCALWFGRRLSGSWLWPFSDKPVPYLHPRSGVFIMFAILFLLPLKNRVLEDVFIMEIQLAALLLIFSATRGLAGRSLDLLKRSAGIISDMRPASFFILLFAIGGLIPLVINIMAFERTPRYVDEINYLFQAKIFAGWRLTADVPPLGEFFHHKNIIQSGHGWYIQHPPGWPAILMWGCMLGVPWLVNPLLGGLLTALVYILGRTVADERCARLAGVLALLSPYLWFMNAALLSHTSCALFLLVFLVCALKVRQLGKIRLALLAGACLGAAANIRPYTAFLVSVPVALLFMRDLLQRRPYAVRQGFFLTAALLPVLGLLLYYNFMTTGDPLLFGYTYMKGEVQALGFGQRFNFSPYTPLEAVRTTFYQFNTISHTLFLWPLPALLPALALFTFHRPAGSDWFLLLVFLSLPAGYFLYSYSGDVFNPRFLFEAAPALLVLTARGLLGMWGVQDNFSGQDKKVTAFRPRASLAHVGIISVLVALLLNAPYEINTYLELQGMGPELRRAAQQHKIEKSIVFLDPIFYEMGIGLIDPLEPDEGNIYARDLGDRNMELMRLYPDRRAFRAVWLLKEKSFSFEPLGRGP